MRRHLRSIYEYLPPDKALTKKKLERWRQALLDRGLSVRTIETAATSAWRTRFVVRARKKAENWVKDDAERLLALLNAPEQAG